MTALLLLGVLFLFGGITTAYWMGTQVAVSRYRRLTGIDRQTWKRYREAAKLLHDLEFAGDIDDQLTIIPPALFKRVSDWNANHRKAIEK